MLKLYYMLNKILNTTLLPCIYKIPPWWGIPPADNPVLIAFSDVGEAQNRIEIAKPASNEISDLRNF